MKLYFKQKMFSFLGDAEIYDEYENVRFYVKGKASWGKSFIIYDTMIGCEVGTIRQTLKSFMPKFEIFLGNDYIGSIKKEFSFFVPRYTIDYNGWSIEGNVLERDYVFRDKTGSTVAIVSKERHALSDRYTLDILEKKDNAPDPLTVLMFVVAIDAEKASRAS